MTRLRSTDIKHIGHTLNDYDASLLKKTGYPLRGIALQAAGISEKAMEEGLTAHRVAVVPIATGEGILEGFAEAVCQILSHLGAKAFITTGTDVQGFAEAMERGATVLFCADDDRFVALRFAPRKVVDNAEATARGFVTALDLMAGGLPGRKVLVIGGAGRVGWKATSLLKDKGAQISVFDIDQLRLETLARGNNIRVETKLEESLIRHRFFFDASPGTGLIRAEHIRPDTLISAPGVPLGVTEEAYLLVQERLIHDPLQIGVATMLAEVVAGSKNDVPERS
jgi:pyrrolysine biosynthesis protein PylD